MKKNRPGAEYLLSLCVLSDFDKHTTLSKKLNKNLQKDLYIYKEKSSSQSPWVVKIIPTLDFL